MNSFNQLRTIFYALALGQFLFAGVVYYVTRTQTQFTEMPIFTILVPAMVLGAAAISYYLNQQLRLKEQDEKNKDARFAMFRRRVIVRLAILEGANLVAIVAALLTGKFIYLLYFIAGMVIFFYLQPRPEEATV